MLVHTNYAIFDHPKDYPDCFVVRKIFITSGMTHPGPAYLATTLEDARKFVPAGYQVLAIGALGQGDPQFLVETWFGQEEMSHNPIEECLDDFDAELKERGIQGEFLYCEKHDIVILALKEAHALLEKDGLLYVADWAMMELKRRGIKIHPLSHIGVLDANADFVLDGKNLVKAITFINTYNRFHKKTQLLIGLEEEAKPWVDRITSHTSRWASDGQNRIYSKMV